MSKLKTLLNEIVNEARYPLRSLDPLAHAVLTKPVRQRGLGFNPAYVTKVEILQATHPTFRVWTKNDEYFDLANIDGRMIKISIGAEDFDLMDMHQRSEATRELDRLLQKSKINAGEEDFESEDDLNLEPDTGAEPEPPAEPEV